MSEYKKSYLAEDLIYQTQGYGKQARTNLGLNHVILRKLLDLPGVPQSGNLLEIGCGDGWGTYYLASRNYQNVIGIDTSQHAVEMAKMRMQNMEIRNVKLLNMDATNMIGLEDENFDVAIDSCCLHCIIDLEERKSFLSSVFRVLKKNGSFLGQSMCQPYTEIKIPYHRENFRIDSEIVLRRLPEGSDFVPFRIVKTAEEIKNEILTSGLKLSWSVHEIVVPGFGCYHFTYHAQKS